MPHSASTKTVQKSGCSKFYNNLPLLILHKNFIQNLLTFLNTPLILKIAFVIIRRLQKPHHSSKTKIIYKNKHKNLNLQKTPIRACHYYLSRTQRIQNSEFFVDLRFSPKNRHSAKRSYLSLFLVISVSVKNTPPD